MTLYKEQHHVWTSLEQHGYNGINDRSNVRFLVNGIKTARLDTVKATILSSDEYHADFDKCITLYKDFIKQSGGQLKLRVAAVQSGGEKPDDGGSEKTVVRDVTDWYYKKEEYKRLSTKQKKSSMSEGKSERGGYL